MVSFNPKYIEYLKESYKERSYIQANQNIYVNIVILCSGTERIKKGTYSIKIKNQYTQTKWNHQNIKIQGTLEQITGTVLT